MRSSSNYKVRSTSFKNGQDNILKSSHISRSGLSPARSSDRLDRSSEIYSIRFKRKDLRQFNPRFYVTATISQQDVVQLKQVFDHYDSTGMGVLLPNDLKILLADNGFSPIKKTVYEIIAEFDADETGGISFQEFMKAMDTKPHVNESKRDISTIFKKYDRLGKGYLNIDDIREMNRQTKQNLDEQIMRNMMAYADRNKDGKVSLEDFYSVMTKNIY